MYQKNHFIHFARKVSLKNGTVMVATARLGNLQDGGGKLGVGGAEDRGYQPPILDLSGSSRSGGCTLCQLAVFTPAIPPPDSVRVKK